MRRKRAGRKAEGSAAAPALLQEPAMSIQYQKESRTITIDTLHTTYQLRVDPHGFLQHLYYGKKIQGQDMSYLYQDYDRACAGNPDEAYPSRRISFNTMPQEYTGYGVGDFRISSLAVQNADGSYGADFRYVSHSIARGKYSFQSLPASYGDESEAETLSVFLEDPVTKLSAELLFGVFEKKDIITRAVRFRNGAKSNIILNKALSMSLDIPYGRWDLIHFHGKHTLERQVERERLTHLVKTVQSTRNTSSHQENPFVVLCGRRADEDHGDCYGFMLAYSGGFRADVELDQFDSVRIAMGIHDDQFAWTLQPGEEFETPEVIMTFTDRGLTSMSHCYHRFIRHNVCRGKYQFARRPVLINNWEATYFGFTSEKILEIADEAAKMGIEMLVLDDGWFGKRDSDDSGLGDWFANENKIKGGLKSLVEQVNAKGLRFGIWMEPEMVNEDSDLYRQHPDWAFAMPGRVPTRSRNQLVLDMSRREVVDYLYERIEKLFNECNIEYLKWDMNRSISDAYSAALPAGRQGEVLHRYVLGIYDLMNRVTTNFPNVLLEGCAGGGSRFDAGIMCYSPQIWCSDDTDPIKRLSIQYGSSFGYPVSTVGAHVSASPNHQTGRRTPFHTRAVVAMSGTFGYELDPSKLTDEEKEEVREQIGVFRKHYDLIQGGLYYRLTNIDEETYEAWQFTAEDRSETLLNLVITDIQPNAAPINIRLKGLDPDAVYELTDESAGRQCVIPSEIPYQEWRKTFSGAMLMNAGYTFPLVTGDYPAFQLYFRRIS